MPILVGSSALVKNKETPI